MSRAAFIAHAAPRVGAANARRQWQTLADYDARTRRRARVARVAAVAACTLYGLTAWAFYSGSVPASFALALAGAVAASVSFVLEP